MSAGAIYAGSAVAAAAILGAAAREAADTGPEYIRDGQPGGIVKRLGLGIARAACRRYAENPGLVDEKNLPLYETACRPYLENMGYGPGPSLIKPFNGGQCPGVYYTVRVSGFQQGQPYTGATQFAMGPVKGFRFDIEPQSPSNRRPVLMTAEGDMRAWPLILPSEVSQWRVTEVFPTFPGPNNCGDPPPIYGAPPPAAPIIPNPEPFNPGPTINVALGVVLVAPGAIQINFGVEPSITIEDPFGLRDGDGDGGGGGGGGSPAGGDGLPGAPDAVGPPAFEGEPGTGGDAIDFGPPPEGRVWVGAIARFNAGPNVGIIPRTSGNRVYTRVVGNLGLTYAGGEGTAHQVRSEWTEAYRPVTALEVKGCRINSLAGVAVKVYPVSAIICPENTCGNSENG